MGRWMAAGRPTGQVSAIGRQIVALLTMVQQEQLGFQPDQPAAIGVSGGRLRLAFMHPDMARFFGPAWQMPIGAGEVDGEEQIVVLMQPTTDRQLHLHPTNPAYAEEVDALPADSAHFYPDATVTNLHAYEAFGTRLSEALLLALGYVGADELVRCRQQGLPLPSPARWVSNNMRRPFTLVGNALASLRTVRTGETGRRVQTQLDQAHFGGLRVAITGNIPPGGFSSSSAVTVATLNALNALYNLELSPDQLVQLACQAEYGTGVRAGSLDQATEQKGEAGRGTLISSNPQDNYAILASYPAPTDRFSILFPYSVERDRETWRWSWGAYAASATPDGPLTAGEMRSLTGKAAEIAALLTHLPLTTSFFKQIEADLLANGQLEHANRRWVADILRQLPLLIGREELRAAVHRQRDWYIAQLMAVESLDQQAAAHKADATLAALFSGWREPRLRRTTADGTVVTEVGVPLRAMLAYLFGEVAKNFYLIHHPDQWIAYVSHSQRGDRCVTIDPARLPVPAELLNELPWEQDCNGPERLDRWLEEVGATPFDYNQGLDDATLSATEPPAFQHLAGSNFFRGLALIDLAEAMLKRAFGVNAVAVRINAAGQGGYFQVHVDRAQANPEEVKTFIRRAFYQRFGLTPTPEFVEPQPGGGAAGLRLSRYDRLPELCQQLSQLSVQQNMPQPQRPA
jgi:hypothetical protein